MSEILLCEPNVSEGRSSEVIDRIAERVRSTHGVHLLDVSSDADHNRTVLSFLGSPEHVLEAAVAMAETAIELIDMTGHRGEHPRLGAVDVVPFVPLREIDMTGAVAIARRFGKAIGERGVPVFYYEAAATRPERRAIPDIRRGEYEGLAHKLADPEWAPDEGPSEGHPDAGAVVTGARGPLVRFNVNLRSTDVGVAKRIARRLRASDGGLPEVRALGFELRQRDMVQVSMNLTDYRVTSIDAVFDAARAEASREGVVVAGTEIIGLLPLDALEGVIRQGIAIAEFSVDQVLEKALLGLEL